MNSKTYCLLLLLAALLLFTSLTACGDDDDDAADDDDAGDDDTTDDDDNDTASDDDTTDDDDDDGDNVLTILTINVQNPTVKPSEVEARTQMVADLINDKKPDFVAVQEAAQTPTLENRAPVLAALTGYEYVWQKTHSIPLFFDEGIAILSAWPIQSSDSVDLPHPDFLGLFKRKVLGVSAATDLGEVHFYCSHMTTADDEEEKADQALGILDFIESHPADLPGFFAGDLNARPDTLAMKMLRGAESYQERQGDFVDSWLEVNDPDPGYSMPSKDPAKRIDYIYLVPGEAVAATVDSCELVFTEPQGGVWASDHLGVLCRYTVGAGR